MDYSGSGRWSWIYVGGGGKATWIITAYQPCNPGKRETRGGAVWNQHARYFEAHGEVRSPRLMFQNNLLSLLQTWIAAGDEIILMGDFNDNAYSGALSRALTCDDLQMSELYHLTTGQ